MESVSFEFEYWGGAGGVATVIEVESVRGREGG